MPAVASVTLPVTAPVWTIPAPATDGTDTGGAARGMVGRFTRAFSYSGPSSSIVHVESQARDGKNAYVDADSPFAGLPVELVGADWVQAASRENLYNAVDLMEVSVVAGAVVSVAHDDRVPRPLWLTAQFQPTPVRLTVAGQPMTVFQRRAARDESLTLGANAERQAAPANMYVVFIQGR
jgi:beta-galactosidase